MLKASCSEEMGHFALQHQQAGYIEMEAGLWLVKKVQHQSRESFRQKCWTQFFERTKRHEIQAMDTLPEYSSKSVKQIQQIASRGGIQAVLVTAGIRSPACVQRYQQEGFFEHVYWQCPQVAQQLDRMRPDPPLEPVQHSYG